MVFADVSGFTRLSERLARTGKEGAEQLVDAINACFSALLADVYGRGGSLVKFGGDAMLLCFDDDGHTERACCRRGGDAANAARGRSHPRRRRATSCCGCRSACTAATYPMFVVGDSHRELLDRRCRERATVVEMESAGVGGPDRAQPTTPRGLLAAQLRRRSASARAFAARPGSGRSATWVSPPEDFVELRPDEAIAECPAG